MQALAVMVYSLVIFGLTRPKNIIQTIHMVGLKQMQFLDGRMARPILLIIRLGEQARQ